MNANNAIEIRNMSKSFKYQYDRGKTLKDLFVLHKRGKKERHVVLKNINLDIKKGETVGLIGTNGSGKSTLLKLMTKIIYPDSGTIKTDGKLTSLLELGAGFHPDFTGRENIYFNAAIFGLTEEEIDERLDEIISFSELGSAIDEPIRTYSSGMYMRLAFSIVINVDADILLVDEILAVGDQHFQEKCYAKLRELKNSDKTIVIVSHSLDVVKNLCDRAIWLYKGNFRLDGDPTYVIDEYLKQVALDHKEEKRIAIENGTASYKGAVFIDAPKDFSHIEGDRRNLDIVGWQISDCENSRFELKIGNKKVENILPVRRQDVYDSYSEEYSGFLDADKIGWIASVNLKDYMDQLDEHRQFHVNASVYDDKGKLIRDKNIVLVYGDEQKEA